MTKNTHQLIILLEQASFLFLGNPFLSVIMENSTILFEGKKIKFIFEIFTIVEKIVFDFKDYLLYNYSMFLTIFICEK